MARRLSSEAKAAHALARELLTALAGVYFGDDVSDSLGMAYSFSTTLGPLRLSIHHAEVTGGDSPNLVSVFGRFDDPKRAHEATGCNPYSGKWNHHPSPITQDVLFCFNDIEGTLDTIGMIPRAYVREGLMPIRDLERGLTLARESADSTTPA